MFGAADVHVAFACLHLPALASVGLNVEPEAIDFVVGIDVGDGGMEVGVWELVEGDEEEEVGVENEEGDEEEEKEEEEEVVSSALVASAAGEDECASLHASHREEQLIARSAHIGNNAEKISVEVFAQIEKSQCNSSANDTEEMRKYEQLLRFFKTRSRASDGKTPKPILLYVDKQIHDASGSEPTSEVTQQFCDVSGGDTTSEVTKQCFDASGGNTASEVTKQFFDASGDNTISEATNQQVSGHCCPFRMCSGSQGHIPKANKVLIGNSVLCDLPIRGSDVSVCVHEFESEESSLFF